MRAAAITQSYACDAPTYITVYPGHRCRHIACKVCMLDACTRCRRLMRPCTLVRFGWVGGIVQCPSRIID